jgi:hypothetical protein
MLERTTEFGQKQKSADFERFERGEPTGSKAQTMSNSITSLTPHIRLVLSEEPL